SDNASREFDAEFMPVGASLFFPGPALAAAVSADLFPVLSAPANGTVGLGGDIGLVVDCSGVIAIHTVDRIHTVADLLELKPSKGNPLKLSVVVASFCEFATRHGSSWIIVDRHVLEPAREHLRDGVRLEECAGGVQAKFETYVSARTMLAEGRVRIPA